MNLLKMPHIPGDTYLETGREVLAREAEALNRFVSSLDERFADAVEAILACRQRVIISGIGKSGHVARKVAATFAATGTPAHFLHAGEAAGFGLAICSNKPQHLCEKIIFDLGLSNQFRVIVGAHASRRNKPAPDSLAEVLAGLEAHPADCLFIGDTDIDRRTAQHFDMPFLFASWGYGHVINQDAIACPSDMDSLVALLLQSSLGI